MTLKLSVPRWLKRLFQLTDWEKRGFPLQPIGIPPRLDKPESEDEFEVASNIALGKVMAALGPSCNHLNVWLSHNYDETQWLPVFAERQAEIDRLRSWAKELTDPTVQRAYFRWLNWYDRELEDARRELRTRATKIEMDRFEQRLAIMRREEEKRQASNPLPDPPRLGARL